MMDPRANSHRDRSFSHASWTMSSLLRTQRHTNKTGAPKEPAIMLVRNIKGDSAPILEIGRKADFDWALNPSRCATANNTTQITVLGINHATLFMARVNGMFRSLWAALCGRQCAGLLVAPNFSGFGSGSPGRRPRQISKRYSGRAGRSAGL